MSEADRDRTVRTGGGDAPSDGEDRNLTAQLEQTSLPAATINDLQDKVMVAVKGAIAGALAERMPELRAPDIDLDFSYASDEQAGTLPAVTSPQSVAVEPGAVAPNPRPANRSWRGLQAGALAGAIAAGALIVIMPDRFGTGDLVEDSDQPAVVATQSPALPTVTEDGTPRKSAGTTASIGSTAASATSLPAADPAIPAEAAPAFVKKPVVTAALPEETVTLPAPLEPPAATGPQVEPAPAPVAAVQEIAPAEAPDAVLDVAKAAQVDLRNGDVVAARRRLLLVAERGELTVDGALLLAMSFDPNHLGSLASPNAAPDRAEAERWYRTWFDLGAKSGLAADPSRLERLIRAMQP